MARSETKVPWTIWQTLEEVYPDAKFLYLVMLTEKTVNNAGIGAVRLGLWSKQAGLDRDTCSAALAELAAHDLVTVDYRTEEILIHDFIVTQGVDREPNKLLGAIAIAEEAYSTILRTRLVEILDNLEPVIRDRPKTYAARQKFKGSSIRKRLREEISAGLHRCAECDSMYELVIDHIRPLVADGTNDLSNLQVLCALCNGRKGARV